MLLLAARARYVFFTLYAAAMNTATRYAAQARYTCRKQRRYAMLVGAHIYATRRAPYDICYTR